VATKPAGAISTPVCFYRRWRSRCYKERQGYTAERTTRVEHSWGVMEKDGRRGGGGVCERKGVTECNDNARFMQPCTAEELANAVRNFFSPVHPPSSAPALRYSCCNAVAVGRKPRRKETSRIALRARSVFCAAEVYPRRCIGAPPRKLRSSSSCRASCCRWWKAEEIAETAK